MMSDFMINLLSVLFCLAAALGLAWLVWFVKGQ